MICVCIAVEMLSRTLAAAAQFQPVLLHMYSQTCMIYAKTDNNNIQPLL